MLTVGHIGEAIIMVRPKGRSLFLSIIIEFARMMKMFRKAFLQKAFRNDSVLAIVSVYMVTMLLRICNACIADCTYAI